MWRLVVVVDSLVEVAVGALMACALWEPLIENALFELDIALALDLLPQEVRLLLWLGHSLLAETRELADAVLVPLVVACLE